ncbi:MAG: FAD:protein FMN transferase [Paracoccus sp. (in: a-proteobacteria)]|uniref:FAD:protein FMN transferase n=1 Tax=Paracoccus sp. TaxID=267 RepID=UPI0026E042BF|nr:FAD:protein FMN transferase [Paracoccus sp. (in: a-proteobacteria)]MDO5620855.1 FAD:protein FMN transferase [Paracoccus sp. (in: a-proteobacteria)]
MMNRRRFLTLSACALATPVAASPQIWTGRAMGAGVSLRLEGATPRQARAFFAAAVHELAHIERVFSLHRDSDLTRLNRTGRLDWPPDALVQVMDLSDQLYHATGGAFDPTVQPLYLARANGRDETGLVVGWDQVRRDQGIRLRPGMALTFNGIAQGYAADRLAALAARHDLTEVLLDTGEIRALGPRDWQAGLADPQGRSLRRITLRDRALATSSAYGTRIGAGLPHILGPDGRAALWDTVSASAPSAALADGLSTALCLMTATEADAALATLPDCRIELALPL